LGKKEKEKGGGGIAKEREEKKKVGKDRKKVLLSKLVYFSMGRRRKGSKDIGRKTIYGNELKVFKSDRPEKGRKNETGEKKKGSNPPSYRTKYWGGACQQTQGAINEPKNRGGLSDRT